MKKGSVVKRAVETMGIWEALKKMFAQNGEQKKEA